MTRTELLTDDIWKHIHEAASGRQKRLAAVAYVSSTELLSDFQEGDVVVCNAGPDALRAGATNPDALEALVKRKVKVFSNDHLHAKVFVFRGVAIVGSANASSRSVVRLDEAAIRTTDPAVVADARNFIEKMRKAKSVLVDLDYINDYARKAYCAPSGGGGVSRSSKKGERAAAKLVVIGYHEEDTPRSIEAHVRKNRERQEGRVDDADATDWSLDFSWDDDPDWVTEGDYILWVCKDTEPYMAYPPLRVFDRTPVGGRSKDIVTWYWQPRDFELIPWDHVKGRVLVASHKQLRLDKRLTDAAAVEAVFALWGMSSTE